MKNMNLQYMSTRNPKITATASQAVLKGLADDGGLFVPERIPALSVSLGELKGMTYQETASAVMKEFLTDYTEAELKACIARAYDSKFDTREIAPIAKVDDTYYLELFHGPTIAFKDMALSILPHLMTTAAKKNGAEGEIISDLVQREGFGPEDVEEIIVDPPVRARMWAPDEGFTSVTHAQFSIPFVIASFLYDPHPGAHWYTPERMKDPKRIALAKRVKAGPSPEESPMSSFKQFREERGFPMKTITVKLKDGRTFVEKMDCHPGHPDNMMSREQFADRFRVQAAPVLQGEALEKALDTLCRIEEVEDISTLDGLLG